jgi:hypothetical protein
VSQSLFAFLLSRRYIYDSYKTPKTLITV